MFCKMEDPLSSIKDSDETPVLIKQQLGSCTALAYQKGQA